MARLRSMGGSGSCRGTSPAARRQLLPEREPAHNWPAEGTLCFVYRYPVLPAALVPGFIARQHRRLSRTPGPWRHGCVLEFASGARTRVIGDAEKKEVTISVLGDPLAARDALDAVRLTFEDMHAATEGLAVDELIPVPGRSNTPPIGLSASACAGFEPGAEALRQRR